MISESSSGICSTEPCQAGKGMGGKCHGKRRDWDTETLRGGLRALQLANLDKEESKQIQKNRDIKTICVEENMDSKLIVLLASPKQEK